ncbi:MAG: PRC-barrel domain-containing protein [Acidimicrobiia bacterium]|nr:PRC-barrel domain-containing protein [Acidimicrobiia bacterium]
MSKVTEYRGSRLLDEHGTAIGDVSDVIYEGVSNEPTWLVVNPGLLRAEHYVPARGAYRTDDDKVVVPFSAEQVKTAPKAKGDHVLSNEVRSVLTQHYHLEI